jgi:hypothetical protein
VCLIELAHCCRVPCLLVILSDARRSVASERESKDPMLPALHDPTPPAYRGTGAARTTVEERRFSAAFSVLTNTGL